MSQRKVIAVDIDDVLVAEAEAIVRYSNEHWGHSLTVDDYNEHWQDMWGVDYDELLRRAEILHMPGVKTRYPLIDGALEAIGKLAERYQLVALTSRRGVLRDETVEWIHKTFAGIFDEVHFTGFWDDDTPGGHLLTKGQMAKELNVDYLIDDQPKHCASAANHGVVAILFGSYKQGADIVLPSDVVRCRNWRQVLEYFDG